MLKTRALCASASLAALVAAASPALAQTNAASEKAVEEVVVTGSRIDRKGFESPTPVVVVGQQELKSTGPAIMADA
ncbi:MAG: hypothetical protein IT548_00540, partial [Alphaproteobacteria bacterium]|nr:hypothetical protein [Alphaproteobacteria bacterium]